MPMRDPSRAGLPGLAGSGRDDRTSGAGIVLGHDVLDANRQRAVHEAGGANA